MTVSITEFVSARLDEDEAAAREAGGDEWSADVHVWMVVDSKGDPVAYDEGRPTEDQAAHIARHDPARVLREVAAKRAILAEHAPKVTTWVGEPDTLSCGRCGTWNEYPVSYPCRTLRTLAAIYSDHPDYNHEWSTE